MDLKEIAKTIKEMKENIFLIYAFNATGKTRLSAEYKEIARNEDDQQTGVYYNAYSEDLFVWNNDIDNQETNIKLEIKYSSLNDLHSYIDENKVKEKLKPYNPKFDFEFHAHEDDPAKGIEYITFFLSTDENAKNIKISRGEERIFIWCFFLTLFDSEGWSDGQNNYFFIDDPISSLDDNNLFITTFTLLELIEKHKDKKIIITTHHIGFATLISDYLTKGEKSDKYKKCTSINILEYKNGDYSLVNPRNEVLLYHLRLLQILDKVIKEDKIELYHMAMLRQTLENVSSFLGVGQIKYVLPIIGFEDADADRIVNIANTFTHRKVYYPQSDTLTDFEKQIIKEVFYNLMNRFKFRIHSEK